MRPEYYCIKDCLLLVQGRDFSTLDKLEVEVILLQVLRCVIQEDGGYRESIGEFIGRCSEDSAKALLEDLQEMCKSADSSSLGQQMLRRVKEFASAILPPERLEVK